MPKLTLYTVTLFRAISYCTTREIVVPKRLSVEKKAKFISKEQRKLRLDLRAKLASMSDEELRKRYKASTIQIGKRRG
jgi:hypothetical protein